MKPQMLSRVTMAENRQAWPFLVLGGVFAAYAMLALLWLISGTAHAPKSRGWWRLTAPFPKSSMRWEKGT